MEVMGEDILVLVSKREKKTVTGDRREDIVAT